MVHADDHAPILMAHPSAELYGSDRVMLESLEAFVATGARVLVALPSAGPLVDAIVARGGEVVFSSTPVLRKNMVNPLGLIKLAGTSISALVRGTRLIRRVRPSAIYVSTLTIPLWMIVGFLNRVPVLCHVHEAEGSASRILRNALVAPLRFADRIVTNSEFSVDVLRRSSTRLASRAQVIYNGVWGPEKVKARSSVSGLRIMYVGRLSHRKGVDIAVSAVARLRELGIDASLDIVGDVFPGYEWYSDDLRAAVERDGTGRSVHFHGFQSDVWSFFADTDVVIVPSRIDEPFGNTAVEAILAARPVVVSDTSGLKEAAAGYRSAQFVAAGDIDDVVAALARIVNERASFFEAAVADRLLAIDRHGVARYRKSIAAAVDDMTGVAA